MAAPKWGGLYDSMDKGKKHNLGVLMESRYDDHGIPMGIPFPGFKNETVISKEKIENYDKWVKMNEKNAVKIADCEGNETYIPKCETCGKYKSQGTRLYSFKWICLACEDEEQ